MNSTTVDTADAAHWDAIVIGAGPAGCMAARSIALRGKSVLLVDRATFPRDKVCGCCVNTAAVDQLHRAGLGRAIMAGRPLRVFELRVNGRCCVLQLPPGIAISRALLDGELMKAAVEAGAVFRPSTLARVGQIAGDHRCVRLVEHERETAVAARVVVVADGLSGGALADLADIEVVVRPRSRMGAAAILDGAMDAYVSGTIYMACGRGGYVGAVRLEDGRLNLAAAFDPSLMDRIGGPGRAAVGVLSAAGCPIPSGLEDARWRGTPLLSRRLKRPASKRVFVVGDAAGYVEPFTGEGIAWALAGGVRAGEFALRAVEHWQDSLAAQWTAAHRSMIGRRQLVCRAARLIVHRPWAAEMLTVGLNIAPRLFNLVADIMRTPYPSERRP